jgi:hypothetical protein
MALQSGSTRRLIEHSERPRWWRRHVGFPECRMLLRTSSRAVLFLTASVVILATGCKGRTSAGAGSADDVGRLRERLVELRQKERVLNAELSLVKDFAPYIVVDFGAGSVELRARGRALRHFSVIEGSEPTCSGGPVRVWKMTDRRPLEELERPHIAPGAGEEAAAEAAKKAQWGPSRMPEDFDLICEGGNVLHIRSLPAQTSPSRLTSGLSSAYRRWLDSFRQWRTSKEDRPRCLIRLWLPEDQAQLLFWSLPRQASILVINGAG